MSSRDTYHHGDLKAAILAEAAVAGGRTRRRRDSRYANSPRGGRLARRACPPLHRPPRAVHRAGDRGLRHCSPTRSPTRGRISSTPRWPTSGSRIDHPGPLRGDVRQVAVRRRPTLNCSPPKPPRRGAGRGVGTLDDPTAKARSAGGRARGMVSGARLFAAVAQRGHRHDVDPMDTVAPDGADAVRRLPAGSVRSMTDTPLTDIALTTLDGTPTTLAELRRRRCAGRQRRLASAA